MRHILLATLCISVLAGKTLPTEGQTWPFAEKNAIQELQEIAERDKDIINARMDKAKKEAAEKVKKYKAPNTTKLLRTTKKEVFYPDMSYELERDIRDAQGRLLYPKGFKFNVMDYTALNIRIVVFDPTDKPQMEWFIKSGHNESLSDMILITDGAAYEIIEKLNRPVYYLTKPITDRFKLKHSPCIIEQEGKRIKVTEVVPTASIVTKKGKNETK